MRRSEPVSPRQLPPPLEAGADVVLQLKVWLLGISPVVWRRVLAPARSSLRELHGVIQVAMGWDGIHLFQFCLRAARYGSWELSASSPDTITLAELRLRKGARFAYEYDLNIPWRHEIRIEDQLQAEQGKAYPVCTGGNGACPPEDCGGPANFLASRDDMLSVEALDDLGTMAQIIGQVVAEHRPEVLDNEETRWHLERAAERSKARERAEGRPFLRRTVNHRFRRGDHRELMRQQW